MQALLDRTLRTVPMLETLGIRVEEASTGRVVLRLPHVVEHVDTDLALHTSTVFAVAELAAATVLGTHPELEDVTTFVKSSRIKYRAASHVDVLAHAELPPETLASIREGLASGGASAEVLVRVLDVHGGDVAELVSHFSLRR